MWRECHTRGQSGPFRAYAGRVGAAAIRRFVNYAFRNSKRGRVDDPCSRRLRRCASPRVVAMSSLYFEQRLVQAVEYP